jgi:hypothetical protein
MIHYQLQCHQGHSFDGWFKDSASFDVQVQAGYVSCPSCNSADVTRALMAPALGRGTKKFQTEPQPAGPRQGDPRQGEVAAGEDSPRPASREAPALPSGATSAAIAESGLPDNVRAVLQRLRAEVERSCDYVGNDFAEEARRIHYGEAEARGIYGEASRTDAEALADEGIEIGVLPWLPRSDS